MKSFCTLSIFYISSDTQSAFPVYIWFHIYDLQMHRVTLHLSYRVVNSSKVQLCNSKQNCKATPYCRVSSIPIRKRGSSPLRDKSFTMGTLYLLGAKGESGFKLCLSNVGFSQHGYTKFLLLPILFPLASMGLIATFLYISINLGTSTNIG